MITFTDHQMYRLFGATWLHNVKAAGITYWVLAVTDNQTAELVGGRGGVGAFSEQGVPRFSTANRPPIHRLSPPIPPFQVHRSGAHQCFMADEMEVDNLDAGEGAAEGGWQKWLRAEDFYTWGFWCLWVSEPARVGA